MSERKIKLKIDAVFQLSRTEHEEVEDKRKRKQITCLPSKRHCKDHLSRCNTQEEG
jgi:hypothetical protein